MSVVCYIVSFLQGLQTRELFLTINRKLGLMRTCIQTLVNPSGVGLKVETCTAALAERGAADRVQARCSRLPLSSWSCATVPRQRPPACRRPRYAAAPAFGVNTRSRRSSVAAVHCWRPCLFSWPRRECGTVCQISSRRQRRCPCSSDI